MAALDAILRPTASAQAQPAPEIAQPVDMAMAGAPAEAPVPEAATPEEEAPAEEPAAEEPAAEESAAAAGQCVNAQRLFFDDFESGSYDAWTSNTYVIKDTGGCHESRFSDEQAVSGKQSHRTSVDCASDQSHRVYGGVQFNGDEPVETYTNSGVGIDAPGGVVTTFWNWLDAENLGPGRWFSPFTVNNSCNWRDSVITLAVEDSTGRLKTSHIQGNNGGQVTYADDIQPFPLKQWVRVTVYMNYHTGEFHVWQDGKSTTHATFKRNSQEICQFHWGLYASRPNEHITLFEDDISVWKLETPLTDFESEPWLGESLPVCQK